MTAYRDRVAIVTGAASGIGLALSQQLARRGGLVTLVDVDRAPLGELTGREVWHPWVPAMQFGISAAR